MINAIQHPVMNDDWKVTHPPLWSQRRECDRYIGFMGKIDIYWSEDMGVFGVLENEVIETTTQSESWYLFGLENAKFYHLI